VSPVADVPSVLLATFSSTKFTKKVNYSKTKLENDGRVTLCWAQLVLGCVTICGRVNHLGL